MRFSHPVPAMDSLKDKVVLITGSSSGIGARTAVLFATCRSRLALTGRNRDNLESVARECVQQGVTKDNVLIITGDLSQEADVSRIMEETVKYFKTIHVLVNNAAHAVGANIEHMSMAQYDHVMQVNVRAIVQLTKLAIPHLRSNKGTVVNVSSLLSKRAEVADAVYCMTKVAVDMFTSVLSLELGPCGVRVNAVNPGIIRTPMMEGLAGNMDLTEFFKMHGDLHPLQRCGHPDEVAQAIVFLASDAASFITGATLEVDGGITKTASWFPKEVASILSQ